MQEQKEVWKDIPNYEGYYKISSFGNVKSLNFNRTNKEKKLKLNINSRGYYTISLWKNKVKKCVQVHQLVAITFLEHKPLNYEIIVDHINNIKTDNRVENLQLISARENASKDKKNTSNDHTGLHFNKKTNKWYSQIRINNKKIHLGVFETEIEASKFYQNALISIENKTEIIVKKIRVKTNKYKGVTFLLRNNKWKASYKNKYLGLYNTEEMANNAIIEFLKSI